MSFALPFRIRRHRLSHDEETIAQGTEVGEQLDHVSPVAWAKEHDLIDPLISPDWCFAHFHKVIARLPQRLTEEDVTRPELLLRRKGRVSIYYTPFDWVNRSAKVMLVGITPGRHQAFVALQAARNAIDEGLSAAQILGRSNRVGSFSGPLRTNLVTMLDGIGVAGGLGINSTAALFENQHDLSALTSAICYPVFVNGANYTGSSPKLTKEPLLRAFVGTVYGAMVTMTTDALVVPLGKVASVATELLINAGRLDAKRCLLGFPHPSGANGWRVRQFDANRETMQVKVHDWFSG